MLMLSKVRQSGTDNFYEVVNYDISKPDIFDISILNLEGFRSTFSIQDRDYYIQDGFLRSDAEIVDIFSLPLGNILIRKKYRTFFSLLCDLVTTKSFFIPHSFYTVGEDIVGENVTSFSNVRVSSSTMFVGFSLITDGVWKTHTVMGTDDQGRLHTLPFYIAIPADSSLSLDLELVSISMVNNIKCNIYLYNNNLPLYPFYDPIEYIPLPIINHLFYKQCKFKNAVDLFTLFLEKRDVVSQAQDQFPRDFVKAIAVEPSIRPTSKQRRDNLLVKYGISASYDDFVVQENLNVFEKFSFGLLSQLDLYTIDNELMSVVYKLRSQCSLYSLLLMELRCKIFITDLVIPPIFDKIIAQGGCFEFHTSVKRVR